MAMIFFHFHLQEKKNETHFAFREIEHLINKFILHVSKNPMYVFRKMQ